ncbi:MULTISPECIES: hypothetical protein [unclassified Mesorhizobium]|uniref:hypothetical protein n=1 Tax=unclassified Mesorhizobium TaxID=325217 RepID=UPI0016723F1F|nr:MULTISPECIES: hypothetical protein [unclassified Mesorhizobium]
MGSPRTQVSTLIEGAGDPICKTILLSNAIPKLRGFMASCSLRDGAPSRLKGGLYRQAGFDAVSRQSVLPHFNQQRPCQRAERPLTALIYL